MANYSIKEVVSLTGISAHTLRKWEVRYELVRPSRTDTNIRFYNDVQLKKLLNISILLNHGYRISAINQMEETAISELITSLAPKANADDEVKILVRAMLEMDENSFLIAMQRYWTKHGLLATVQNLIYPFLNQVGLLWQLNTAMPSQEHFVSNLIRQRIFAAIDGLPMPAIGASRMVLFLPEGEMHELGLLLAHYIARNLGWHTYYLGQSVPLENLKEVLDISKANLLMTMFMTADTELVMAKVKEVRGHTNAPLLFYGYYGETPLENLPSNCYYVKDPGALVDFLSFYKISAPQ